MIFCLCLNFSFAFAQANEAEIGTKRAEMKKLDELIGQWKGPGWIERGKERENFVGTETVQKKLDGLALLVEGRFTAKVPPKNEEKVIHETLAVLSYNSKTKIYDFNTFLANGITGQHEFKAAESGWIWGFQFPQGSIRYFIKIENDTWMETGEISMDGKTWRKFFEMNLQKVK